MDADAHRMESLDVWGAAAAGWARRAGWFNEATRPISHWMVDAVRLQPGHRVLELAAGAGETGFLAAELIAPGGHLISSDQAETMLELGRARAGELGLSNVEFKVLDAEWIDLPLASLDAVLCRFGYMLMVDPAAALRETRRVLAPGGRLALAVWDRPETNPWSLVSRTALEARGLRKPVAPGTPGPFALGDADRVGELVEDAGFTEIELDSVEIVQRDPDFETWWEGHLDMSTVARTAVETGEREAVEAAKAEIRAGLAPYIDADGAVAIPGRAILAAATA
ncbi:MAG TPA: methyltransferase domain-containing protein [Solirubrobacteraceae bacterium]|jgi:ubiquinone/menaquinone biosynthesis C-methylase UbiE|nr:methyltransferase domain-containing protein [Solirubrobacteraceae bacterium]